jgi:hypothetical protein
MKWGPQTWDSIATILQNNKSWKKTIDNGWRGEEDLPPTILHGNVIGC